MRRPVSPAPQLELLKDALTKTPFKDRVFLVGGCVRDRLLGTPEPDDLDLVVQGSALEVAKLLYKLRIADSPPAVYARFGTAMVMVQGRRIELATARAESYQPGSRKPEVVPASLEEDMLRRDFTINSLMESLWTGEVIDLLGRGLADLKQGILRTPRDPLLTFADDPLRMLRAVRFKHRFTLTYAPGLEEAIQEKASECRHLSQERIRDELVKMILHPTGPAALEDLRRLGLIEVFAPELAAMKGVEQGGAHHLDVWDHTLLTLGKAATLDLPLALACLLHDIGKPRTKSIEADGRIRFFKHEDVGAELSFQLLFRQKFSVKEARQVSLLVKNHMRLGSLSSMTPSAARRLVREMGADTERLLDLIQADILALRPGQVVMDLAPFRQAIAEVRESESAPQWESPLDGREIMEATGLPPGPELGAVKERLREEVIEGRIPQGDKEAAYGWLRTLQR